MDLCWRLCTFVRWLQPVAINGLLTEQQFCEGMETRGWKAFDGSPEPKNREISLPSSPKLSKSHSPITKETLIKWFERSFSASYSIKITESDPELYQELLQRIEGK